jgi:lactate dehydrogenase-like 2-hydroxyacid dehydrogenase
MDSKSRSEFLKDLKGGGKYHGAVGIYRHNVSADRIGVFDAEIINALAPSVKWIAHNGAGYDQIDVNACKSKGAAQTSRNARLQVLTSISGIQVSNTPGAVDAATATTALFLMLSAVRHYSPAEQSLRAGTWKPSITAKNAHDLAGRTLCIFGLGGIGLQLAKYAHAFPMRVIYHARKKHDDAPEWMEYFGPEKVEEMLGQTDVLSIHVPLRKETEKIIGEREIRWLKKGSVIINTARGKVIDEEAMIRALKDGHVSSISPLTVFLWLTDGLQLNNVGLDVYPDEPNVNPELLKFPQLALLPHMGTENQDAQRLMEVRALTNLRDYLTTGKGKDLVPELRSKL